LWRSRVLALGLAVCATVAVAPAALACPDCAVGRQARTEVWNDDFAFNLFVALLPFLMIGAVCLRVEAIGRATVQPPAARSARVTRRRAHP